MLSVVAIVVRAFTLLFGIVVLGLSVTLAKQQVVGSPPSETSFSSFAGAFGIIVSIIGLVSLWVDKIPTTFVMGADAVASVLYLAGGIALTVALKGVSSCTSNSGTANLERFENKILNGGCTSDGCYSGGSSEHDLSQLIPRCQRAQADYVFEFLGFVFGLALVTLGWFLHKRGGSSSRSYV